MPASKSCPLVLVEWEDSAQPVPRWRYLSDIPTAPSPVLCRTTGWLLVDSKRVKVIAQSLGAIGEDAETAQASGVMTIVASAVRRIWRLKEPG